MSVAIDKYKLRRTPVSRFSPDYLHSEYGITKWFSIFNIYDDDVIKECMGYFAKSKGKENILKHIRKMVNFSQNNFNDFMQFSQSYLLENNYIKTKNKPTNN
jgi:predicted transcriptional regulator